jgi:PBSX family phage terminase large subunit
VIEIHNKFIPLLHRRFRNYVFYGGRDSTKSWSVAQALIALAYHNTDLLILCAKGTQNSIADSVKSLLDKIISYHNLEQYFYSTDTEIVCNHTGSRFIFKGLQNVKRLKSLESVDIVWIEESNIDTKPETFEVLIPTIRKPGSILIYTFNPELEEDWVYQRFIVSPAEDDYVQKITYKDNKFLSDESIKEINRLKEENYEKYLHIYEGEVVKQIEGALWKRNMIKHTPAPDRNFDEVVVAVDPSTTDKATSDACGIIVAAKKGDEYYILDDGSEILSPLDWAKRAISLYEKWQANRIVYEGNQGGMMVKTIIHQINPAIRCISYHARKNKMARAEEILSLYEQDKVHHVRNFTELEYEMVTYTGDKKQKSPNRLDALVYALKNLSKIGHAPRGTVRGNMKTMTGVMRPKVANPNRF